MIELSAIIVIGLVAAWLLSVAFLFAVRPEGSSLREGARLLPDTLRLVRRLTTDRTIPRTARLPIWLLLVYLALPIDLVPDFLPVIGYADDVILTTFVLRRLIRRAGPETVWQHWSGSPDGLAALRRVLRLS